MTNNQVPVETLLARLRRDEISESEDQKLQAMLEHCPEDKVLLEVGQAFDEVLSEQAGDGDLAMRLAERLAPRAAPTRRLPLGRIGALAAAACLITGSAIAGGLWIAERRGSSETEARKVESQYDQATPGTGERRWTTPHPDQDDSARQSGAPTDVRPGSSKAVDDEPVGQGPVTHPTKPTSAQVGVSKSAPLTADGLLTQANDARRTGKTKEALALYGKLQAKFPSSSEAHVSHVSVGRLLLESAPQKALSHYNAYLRAGGALTAEALFGKANALQRLGQTAEERATWSTLQARYPGGVYESRAKQRLRQMDSALDKQP